MVARQQQPDSKGGANMQGQWQCQTQASLGIAQVKFWSIVVNAYGNLAVIPTKCLA